MLEVSAEDKETLKELIRVNGFEEPEIKMSIYKNRRGQYKDILLWCAAKRGTCKIIPLFATTYDYKLVNLPDLKIKVDPRIQSSAF